jgi:hypothetical protein
MMSPMRLNDMHGNETALRRRIGIAAILIAAAFALVIAVATVVTLPLQDPVYLLGPGLYPFALSVLLFLACCLVFLETLSGRHDDIEIRSLVEKAALKKPAGLLILTVISLAVLPVLGFLITISLFSFAEMTLLEQDKRKWWVNAIYAVAVAGGVYALFTALAMTLPEPFWL